MSDYTATTTGRLDHILSTEVAHSRTQAKKLIQERKISVNGTVVKKPAYIVKAGDIISVAEIRESPLQEKNIESVNLHLEVLYEDDACLVLNKPAGIAVHPAASMPQGEQTILSGVAFLFRERSIPFSADAVLVHRLDKETTGCLLIAKSAAAHVALQKQFEKRTVEKTYLALVAGIPDPPEAMIDAPVGRNLLNRLKMSVLRTSVSREARTTYHTLSTSDNCAFLACDLHTGRTHQIRVHLRSIGHPILGDTTYVSHTSQNITENYQITGLCLHAWKLAFLSPATDQRQCIVAPLSSIFTSALASIGIMPPTATAD
ncbi:MAG: RluA family pseudouridine synthase [Candidatus Peribacteraceae bacterium]